MRGWWRNSRVSPEWIPFLPCNTSDQLTLVQIHMLTGQLSIGLQDFRYYSCRLLAINLWMVMSKNFWPNQVKIENKIVRIIFSFYFFFVVNYFYYNFSRYFFNSQPDPRNRQLIVQSGFVFWTKNHYILKFNIDKLFW